MLVSSWDCRNISWRWGCLRAARPGLLEIGLGTYACPTALISWLPPERKLKSLGHRSWNLVLIRRTLGFKKFSEQKRGGKVEVFSPALPRATPLPTWRSRTRNNNKQDNSGSGPIPLYHEWENTLTGKRRKNLVAFFPNHHSPPLYLHTLGRYRQIKRSLLFKNMQTLQDLNSIRWCS